MTTHTHTINQPSPQRSNHYMQAEITMSNPLMSVVIFNRRNSQNMAADRQ